MFILIDDFNHITNDNETKRNKEQFNCIILIEKLIKKYQANSTIIFCNQRVTCEELADSLFERDIDSEFTPMGMIELTC